MALPVSYVGDVGDVAAVLAFNDVGDVARAVYLATINPISGVFNVGAGVGLSLRQILAEIKHVTGRDPSVTWQPSRTFDVPRIVLNAQKLTAATGWTPSTTLREGMKRTAIWLQKSDL